MVSKLKDNSELFDISREIIFWIFVTDEGDSRAGSVELKF